MDRGLKWDEVYVRSLELTGTHDGFYLSKVGVRVALRSPGAGPQRRGAGGGGAGPGARPHTRPAQVRGKPSCLLAEQNRGKHFTVYKPNVGRQSQPETYDSLCRKFRRVRAGRRGRGAGRGALHRAGGWGTALHWGGAAGRPVLGAHEAAGPQVTAEEAREHWQNSYAFSLTHCSHAAW